MSGPRGGSISAQAWSAETSPAECCRRAGGRSHYNAMRGFRASLRRLAVLELPVLYGAGHGSGARIARVRRFPEHDLPGSGTAPAALMGMGG